MAIVRILATRIPPDGKQPPNMVYRAQIFENADDDDASWTCIHEHRAAAQAQLCGIGFLTDRRAIRHNRGAA